MYKLDHPDVSIVKSIYVKLTGSSWTFDQDPTVGYMYNSRGLLVIELNGRQIQFPPENLYYFTVEPVPENNVSMPTKLRGDEDNAE